MYGRNSRSRVLMTMILVSMGLQLVSCKGMKTSDHEGQAVTAQAGIEQSPKKSISTDNAAPAEHAKDTEEHHDPLPAAYADIMQKEAEWLGLLQFDSGAIPLYSGPAGEQEYKVIPYFANIAMLGLLELSGSESVVRRYMDWYFAHLNRSASKTAPLGSVYDYVIGSNKRTETATGDFDSTDSYAATFLNLLRKYAEVTGDTGYLLDRKNDILLIADAILATQQPDGLTWAKPTYRVKFLMDNTEVYNGLKNLEWMCEHLFGDDKAAAKYRQHKNDVQEGIEKELWNESTHAYAYAKMEDGSRMLSDWNKFYPDAAAQLSPLWTGVLKADSQRAKHLYQTFNDHHPGWPTLDKSDPMPWALLAYTAAIMGDRSRAEQFLTTVKNKYIDQGHPWPWYTMESGVSILVSARMKPYSVIFTAPPPLKNKKR